MTPLVFIPRSHTQHRNEKTTFSSEKTAHIKMPNACIRHCWDLISKNPISKIDVRALLFVIIMLSVLVLHYIFQWI